MAPPPKLVWTPTAEMSSRQASTNSSPAPLKVNRIHGELQETRLKTASDITKFDFNKKRTQLLGGSEVAAEKGKLWLIGFIAINVFKTIGQLCMLRNCITTWKITSF